MENKKKLKADIILVAVLLVVCVVAFVVIQMFVKKDGAYAVVKVDGREVHRLSLDADTSVEVEGYQGGFNTVVVKGGKVSVTHADCPDSLCVKTGEVHKTGETIVCLPHRVVVEITGAESGLDSEVR